MKVYYTIILFVHDVIYILYIYKIYNKVMFLPICILSITSLHKTLGSTCLKEFRRGVITCALPSTSSLTLGKVSFFFPLFNEGFECFLTFFFFFFQNKKIPTMDSFWNLMKALDIVCKKSGYTHICKLLFLGGYGLLKFIHYPKLRIYALCKFLLLQKLEFWDVKMQPMKYL